MAHLYQKYVWEVPVRVTHWVIFLAIIILSVTGIYIGAPKTLALEPSQYVMGWIRFIHFVAGYAFTISVLRPHLLDVCREPLRVVAGIFPDPYRRGASEHDGHLQVVHLPR